MRLKVNHCFQFDIQNKDRDRWFGAPAKESFGESGLRHIEGMNLKADRSFPIATHLGSESSPFVVPESPMRVKLT